MFEKDAEEIANKRCHEIMCYGHCSFSSPKHHRCGEWHREYNCAKEGIEYGYNKANEWHYVKDGDLPTKEQEEKQLLVRVRNYTEDFILAYYMLDKYYSPHGKRFYSDTECDSPINIKNIVAWKEIVLPELPKESE